MHGTDEQTTVEGFGEAVRFYMTVMKLGAESVFVGSGIFKSSNPEKRARAIVTAVAQYNDPKALADCSRNLGEAMKGVQASAIPDEELLQVR